MIRLQSDIAAIRDQLAATDMDRQAKGETMDANWFHRAKTAIRFKREELAHLQEHLRTLPDGPRERKQRLQECILAIVRSDYDNDEWQEVLDKAHDIMRMDSGAV
ncbi:MAG: hypothetical protein HQL58_10935 [Magnetococcales bacterium]|nr:hypothetical protein [Magnetococcales bacterium]